MKPLIGITVESRYEPENERSGGELKLNWNYAEAVAKAGGNPILIPPTADAFELARILDGLVIPGGYDIDAGRYGQVNHPTAELQDPHRFQIESELYSALSKTVPILGICYGCQFLNVVQGGTLHQHIPEVYEGAEHTGGRFETYAIAKNSLAGLALGSETVEGKSYHHQSIDRPGANVLVVGHADDGVVEAIEVTDRDWAVGVQWHPERTGDSIASRQLLATFIARAQTIHSSRH